MTQISKTDISRDSEHLEVVKGSGVGIPRPGERGFVEHLSKTRAEFWVQENLKALGSSNLFVEKNGLPLVRHRQF